MGSDAVMDALAAEAALGWGGFATPPVLIHRRENAVYRTSLPGVGAMALRLHRAGYHSDAAIEEELAVCEALADAGFACPWPWRTGEGGFLHRLSDGETRASLLKWVEAVPLSAVPEADLPPAARYEAVGALLADLHLTADAVAPPMTERQGWSTARLTGQGCPWGDWESSETDPAIRDLIRGSREAARSRLDRIPAAERGLIHGDALPDNILVQGRELFLIDFDDCGPGYRLYDLATALITLAGSAVDDAATEALIAGYADAGGPLGSDAFADLPLFLMLRAQASAAWAASRCSPADPKRQLYRDRAVALTRAAMAG